MYGFPSFEKLKGKRLGGLRGEYFCGLLGHLLVEIDEVLLILCLGDLEKGDAGDFAGHGERWCGVGGVEREVRI